MDAIGKLGPVELRKLKEGMVAAEGRKAADEKQTPSPVDRVTLSDKSSREVSGPLPANLVPHDGGKAGTIGGVLAGVGIVADFMLYPSDPVGAKAYIHETAHATAAKAIFNADTTVQVDGIDNLKNFLADPSGDTWKKLASGYDVNQDGVAGVTQWSDMKDTPLSSKLGKNMGMTVVAAAGQAAIEAPQLLSFAAGFALRKNHPVLGYTLMATSTINHFTNTIYPLSAVGMSGEALNKAAAEGNDFAQIARNTGISPGLVAGVFAMLLPAEYLVLKGIEKLTQRKVEDKMAFGQLVQKGTISEDQIKTYLEKYEKKEGLNAAQSKLDKLLSMPATALGEPGIRQNLVSSTQGFQKEYGKFMDYMIDENRDRVEAEKKNLPPQTKLTFKESMEKMVTDYKTAFKKDTMGTVLKTAGLGGGLAIGGVEAGSAVAGKLLTGAARTAALGTTSAVLKTLIPGVGMLLAADAIYTAAKDIKNPEVSKADKAFSATSAFFATVSAASFLAPPVAPFLAIGGAIGMVGTLAAKWLYHKVTG